MSHKTDLSKSINKIAERQEIMRDKPKCEICLGLKRHGDVKLLWFNDTVRVWKCKGCNSLWKTDISNE